MKVRVTISDDHGFILRDAVLPVDDQHVDIIGTSLDFPSPKADILGKMLCTPRETRETVMKNRETLAGVIAHEIMKHFCSKDTMSGYPMERD